MIAQVLQYSQDTDFYDQDISIQRNCATHHQVRTTTEPLVDPRTGYTVYVSDDDRAAHRPVSVLGTPPGTGWRYESGRRER